MYFGDKCGTRIMAILFFMAFLILYSPPSYPAARLTLVTPKNTIDTVISEVIVRKAYRRIGIDVTIEKYPAERAIRLANRGVVDGEVQRIDGISKKYPDLIQVYPPINYIDASVFSRYESFEVRGWESLRSYRIGIIRGIKFAERNTKGMNVAKVGGYQRLFRMLNGNRIDVAASPRVNGWFHIKRLKLTGIKEIKPHIMRFDLFHYLHKKNAKIVPMISNVF
jgi:ABC-type amino acid transport substrate-binding protein